MVDDSEGYGVLVSAWLNGHADVEVVGAVQSAEAAIDALLPCTPDVLLLDHFLPDAEQSRRVLDHVRSELPAAAVILISGMPITDLGPLAVAVGADHFVSKAADAAALAEAISVGASHRARTRAAEAGRE